ISGETGLNGYFTGYSTTKGVHIRKLQVYDRWGNLMYEGRDLKTNEPEQGWNGTYKGMKVSEGVYIWIAETELPDGTKMTHKGDVTVVR
ncbi:MAG: gliding motility-associated C-terminal domain-containing protein, partial [Saprospiraceae bacterium]|nr:gliding motility-associated C-terminal domain-containing protein [Saprospiraceae bacterium]